MATYRGGEIPVPPQPETDLQQAGPPLPGLENVEEELGLPEEAGSDMLRRPGMKGYMDTKPMTELPLPEVGSSNIEDRRGLPPPPQGEGQDDRVEPSEEWKQQQLRNVDNARQQGTLREYDASAFSRQSPLDMEFEPRRRKHGSDTIITPTNKFR